MFYFSRFGVATIFEQISKGENLTLTHPDMTRFLMPLSDAIELVLHALRNGGNGDLFIHKAQAANMKDVAKACLKLANSKNNIAEIGIRWWRKNG